MNESSYLFLILILQLKKLDHDEESMCISR